MANLVRIVAGLKPSTGDYHHITVYDDDSIKIQRLYSQIDPRCEWPTLYENNWLLHKHLIWLIQPTAYVNIHYCKCQSSPKTNPDVPPIGSRFRSLKLNVPATRAKCVVCEMDYAVGELRTGRFSASPKLKATLLSRHAKPVDSAKAPVSATQLQLF